MSNYDDKLAKRFRQAEAEAKAKAAKHEQHWAQATRQGNVKVGKSDAKPQTVNNGKARLIKRSNG